MEAAEPLDVLVIGAGLMGAQIAVGWAAAGHRVTVIARNQEAAAARLAAGVDVLRRLRPEVGIAADWPGPRLTGWDAAPLAEVDLAIESVGEDLELKAELLGRVGEASARAILATNTSSLRITDLGTAVGDPGRVVGLHYWNPPLLMPAVEVVRGEETAAAVERMLVKQLEAMGRIPIVARRDVSGFVWNRLQAALLREAVWLVDNGVATPETVDAAIRHGLAPRALHTGIFDTVALGGTPVWNALIANVAPVLSNAGEVGDLSTRLAASDPERLRRLAAERDAGLAARMRDLGGPEVV
jgi:3-hydroxybutyryl-CoA dehydrogenase